MEKLISKYHKTLANYFAASPHFFDLKKQKKPNIRKCMELPLQQTKAEMWDEVTDTLCDLNFIQAKCAAKFTYDLVEDLNTVLGVIPDNAENIRQEKERKSRMDKYTKNLIDCAKGEISIEELDIPKSITPWSDEKIEKEIERIKINPSRADRLKDYLNFLGQEADDLQKYTSEFTNYALQQAWNNSAEGTVGNEAENIISSTNIFDSILLKTPGARPIYNPLPLQLKVLKGHTAEINTVCITPNGKKAISGSEDKSCILWNLESGRPIKKLVGHTDGITSVSITPDGKKAISGSKDKSCILWNLESGRPIKKLVGHTDGITSVSITPDGKKAISGSKDKSCILWNLQNGRPIKKLTDNENWINKVIIRPDGKMAISLGVNCIFWNLEDENPIKKVIENGDRINAISITANGRVVITASENNFIFWNLESGSQIKKIIGNSSGYKAEVCATPDGKIIISQSYDNYLFWNLEDENPIKKVIENGDCIDAISITANGKMAITASGHKCVLWNLEKGIQINKVVNISNALGASMVISVTPDGKKAISGSRYDGCNFWDLESGKQINEKIDLPAPINAISITPDGKKAISGSEDNSCIFWDVENMKKIKKIISHFDHVNDVSITPDGKTAISCSTDESCIFWDIESGEPKKKIVGHKGFVHTINITLDGKRAITSSDDRSCILWDLEKKIPIKKLIGHKDAINSLKITPDGKMAISSSNDHRCILWDLDRGFQKNEIHWKFNTASNNTSEGKMAISMKQFALVIESITPDGKIAIIRFGNDSISLWNLRSGQVISNHLKNIGSFRTLCMAQDGRMLISGSSDPSCILWELGSGRKIARLNIKREIEDIKNHSNRVVVGCLDCEVLIIYNSQSVLNLSIPIITVNRIWDFEYNNYLPYSVGCPMCGYRFSPDKKVIFLIKKILKENNIDSEDSPCLKLPKEAWDEPGLLGVCPKCEEKLKFNPFIAGGEN